jgi:hypothetical protein
LSLLAFLSSSCLSCREFWTAFAQPDLAVPGSARVIVVTKGAEAESPPAIRALAPPNVTTVMSSAAWVDYKVPGAPYFVLVDGEAQAVVGEGTGGTWEQVTNLFGQALTDAADRRGAANGVSRIDRDLRAAGIAPGHPSLWPEPTAPEDHP